MLHSLAAITHRHYLQIVAYQSCDADPEKILSPKPDYEIHFHRRDSMTETSHPVTAITGPDIKSISLPSVPLSAYPRYGASQLDGAHEDDGQINCPCGYPDDDGNTVACDICNRWQHILCYYPQYAVGSLPEDLQHYCVDCRPRPFDAQAARQRQQDAREHQYSLTNGIKRQPTKSKTKKVKDPASSGITNGWPLDKHRHDRNSASPRDQPPPAKRPKTSHRSTNSTVNTSSTSRKRNGSTINHRRSMSRSPETPVDAYSDEFLRCYWDDEYAVTHANLHNSIAVTNTLTEWLNNPDEVFRITNGVGQHSIFQRWDGVIEEIAGHSEIEIVEEHDDGIQMDNGHHPSWKKVALSGPLAYQACIGELRGHVGFKEEYTDDPVNRWPALRHPEPFVFFHPHLPIYIDARNEGTIMRYVRRSCAPNAELKVIITNGTDYHFCFIATRDIAEGEEIAVAWDSGIALAEMQSRSSNGLSTSDLERICRWVSVVLANCGPCACNQADCWMARFDRRGQISAYEDGPQSVKMPKANKKRRAGHHISPLNTHAVNSRSGSEARKGDLDDEPTDSRSASGSRESVSRDITPNTHYSANGSHATMAEGLSERERKKLAKEEEMFRRQEEEATGKTGKKKRNSAGSNTNTPSATSSKHFNFPAATSSRYADAGTSKPPSLPSAKSSNGKRPRAATAAKTPVKAASRTVKAKPDYKDADTQCDLDKEEAARRTTTPTPKRSYISVTQRLLERCALNNSKRRAPPSTTVSPMAARSESAMDVDRSPEAHSPPAQETEDGSKSEHSDAEPICASATDKDTEMADAGFDEHVAPIDSPATERHESPHEKVRVNNSASPHPPMEPPPPPWPDKASSPVKHDSAPTVHIHKPTDMHLQMPPPSANPFSMLSHSQSSSSDTPSAFTAAIAQSPLSLTSAATSFSPAVMAAVTPSPARKKLSLSDYTKRNKATKEKEVERESSPASVASGPVVPPLPTSLSEAERVKAGGSAVEEDVKMEEAG